MYRIYLDRFQTKLNWQLLVWFCVIETFIRAQFFYQSSRAWLKNSLIDNTGALSLRAWKMA